MNKNIIVIIVVILLLVGVGIVFIPASSSHKKEIIQKPPKIKIVEKENKKNEIFKPVNNWVLKNYVDSFGDLTAIKYISTINPIIGKFGNTATTGSCLEVNIMANKDYIEIQLFEYCRNHPVKNYRTNGTKYLINIKDDKGKIHSLMGINFGDGIKLFLDRRWGQELHQLLLTNYLLKFLIFEDETSATEYTFEVDCTGYSKMFYSL